MTLRRPNQKEKSIKKIIEAELEKNSVDSLISVIRGEIRDKITETKTLPIYPVSRITIVGIERSLDEVKKMISSLESSLENLSADTLGDYISYLGYEQHDGNWYYSYSPAADPRVRDKKIELSHEAKDISDELLSTTDHNYKNLLYKRLTALDELV